MLCFTIVYKREQMKYKSEANCVEKKDFAKGFLSGVLVVVLLVTAVKSFSVVQGIFSTNMSAETKIKTIQKYIDKYYVEEYDKKDMEEMMYAGLVAGLGDPYTSYIPAIALPVPGAGLLLRLLH